MPAAPFTTRPDSITPPPKTRTDDRGHRRMIGRGGRAVPDEVCVERRRVPVVVVDDREAEPSLESRTDVEPAPLRLTEVRGTAGGDHPVRARRTRRVQTHGPYVLARDTASFKHVVQRVGQRLNGDFRTLLDAARRLHHTVHQERARRVENRRVVARAAVVQTDDNVFVESDDYVKPHEPAVPPPHGRSFVRRRRRDPNPSARANDVTGPDGTRS